MSSLARNVAAAALRTSTRPAWMPRPFLRAARLQTPSQRRHFSELHPTPIFQLTETEELLQDTVDRFSKDTILPRVRDMDEAESMDPTVVSGLFENGLMGVEIPEEYGGAGMGFGEAVLAVEALAKVDPSVSVMCDVHNTLVNTIFLKYASKGIKEEFLPRLATKDVGSFCLSEPASGSDAFALQTRAKLSEDGSHYILNGSKSWITNAQEAGVFIVFANVAPEKGYKGITAFIVEKGQEGFAIAKKEKKLGIRASSTCQLTFDDVKVPKDRILGEIGKGYKIAISILNEGRIGIAAQMIGLAQGAFDNAVNYVFNERKQFGKFIGDFQGLQFQIAQSRVEIEAARALVWNAVRVKQASDAAIAAGEPTKGFVAEAAMAKLYASQVAQKVSGGAIEWMGGMGFVREGLAEKFWRDSKIGAIYEGTSNIQLQTIAKILKEEVKR